MKVEGALLLAAVLSLSTSAQDEPLEPEDRRPYPVYVAGPPMGVLLSIDEEEQACIAHHFDSSGTLATFVITHEGQCT